MHTRVPHACAALVGLLVVAGSPNVRAQATPVIKVDLATRTFDKVPPFDVDLILQVPVDKHITTVELSYGPVRRGSGGARFDGMPAVVLDHPGGLVRGAVAVFHVAPMAPNKEYLFRFVVDTGRSTGADTVNVLATADADVSKHFNTDFGLLWSARPGPGYVGAGSNVHYYLVPVNKDEEPGNLHGWNEIRKRVSLFAGLSFVKLYSAVPVQHRYSAGTPVWGIGFRPRLGGALSATNFFRVNLGMMYFDQDDPNPLVDERRPKHAPFASITGDIVLKDVFGPLAAIVGLGK